VPINPSIPLQVQGIDPNGFTNALAAGMKMRELQQAGDRLDLAENRLARKDEAAVRKNNALSKYGASQRTPEDRAAVWGADPASGMALDRAAAEIDQNTQDAAYNKVRTENMTTDVAIKKHAQISQLLVAAKQDPSLWPQVRAKMIEIEPSVAKTAPEGFDAAYIDIGIRTGAKLGDQLRIQKANEPPKPRTHWDNYRGRLVTEPSAGAGPEAEPTVAPPGPPAPPPRRPTMVPGGTSGYSTEAIKAEIARLDQGGAPSENFFGKTKDPRGNLVMLLQAQTDLEAAQGGAATPDAPQVAPPGETQTEYMESVYGPAGSKPTATPPPVDGPPIGGQPAPLPVWDGPPRSPSEAAHRAAQQREARAVESNRLAGERQDKGFAHAEKMAEDARAAKAAAAEAKRSQPTPQIAAKNREKLQTLDIIDTRLDDVEAAFMGPKNPDGTRKPGGIEGSFSVGLAGGYLPTAGGRSYDATVDALRPFLRQISRTPGEGPMSDYETKQAEALLPARNDHPSVVKQKIQQIRNIVKQSRSGMTAPAAPAAAEPAALARTPVKAPQKEFDAMPMPGEYTGKRIKTDTGHVYRSNGREWVRE
jgi:hypothetical protein